MPAAGFTACALLLAAVMLAPLAATVAAVSPAQAVAALGSEPGRSALATSFAASALAIAIACILGVPGGYGLARSRAGLRAVVLSLLALPLAFPPVASGIMLLQVLGARSPLVDSLWGVAAAQFFVAGSLVAITSAAAFAGVDPSYEETAMTLGSGRLQLFFRIALPLAAPGVVAGILLAWMRAIGEYGATSVVAYHPTSLPVQLYVALSAQGVGPALALSYGFIVLAALVLAAQWALRRRVV